MIGAAARATPQEQSAPSAPHEGGVVTPDPEPAHLSHHHRDTLNKILEHPVSHNIEWGAVVSLLQAVGSVERAHDGRFVVVVGAEKHTFQPPRDKDIDAQQVVDLRRMLTNAGYRSS
jgi:hypothetical protein